MKPLNVIQIGKKYTDEIKTFKCYQNRASRMSATLSKSGTQISAAVLFLISQILNVIYWTVLVFIFGGVSVKNRYTYF